MNHSQRVEQTPPITAQGNPAMARGFRDNREYAERRGTARSTGGTQEMQDRENPARVLFPEIPASR